MTRSKHHYQSDYEKKITTSTENLCHELLNEFAIYMNYVKQLQFKNKSDYFYFYSIFHDLFVSQSFQHNDFYD